MDYISVHLVNLPDSTKGFTVKDINDDYTILINARLSDQMQHEAYEHELAHIKNGDFDTMYDINVLEHVRHDI